MESNGGTAVDKKRKKRQDYSAMDQDNLLYNGGMAQKKGASDHCLTWIADEQLVHETAEYGSNKKSVGDALDEQRRRVRLVDRYSSEVEKAAKDTKSEEERNQLKGQYDSLSATANKRLSCLKDIAQIASLEDLFGSLTNEFAQKATDLVASGCKDVPQNGDKDGTGMSRAAQSCILAVRQNWNWISRLVRCSDIHLQHVSDYHQFFHDIKEYEIWMPVELEKVTQKVQKDDKFNGSKEDADRMLVELKEVLAIFLHWEGKIDNLFDRSRRIIPVPLRTKKVDHNRPVSSLCDYRTNEIKISEGEELTLLDNSKTQLWKVRNMHLREAAVPSVICLIPGPDPAAVSAALKLRVQLLYVWTMNVKRIGKSVIWFLNLILREWTKDEAKMIRALPADKKKEVSKCLDHIESDLDPYWSEYPDYKTLKEKIEELRKLLAQEGDGKESEPGNALVVQTAVVDDLLCRYQDLWKYWQTYKILTESSRHSEYMLIAEQLENMKWIETLDLINKWHIGLDFDESELKGAHDGLDGMNGTGEEVVEEMVEAEQVEVVESEVANGFNEGIAVSSEHVTRTAAADRLTQSEQEEKKTFVITGVIDPRTEEEISMAEAVRIGIINNTDGTYVNLATGESYPIPVAMNAGQIKVEFTSTKKTAEKRRDVGLITIKTQKESRPYTVKAVIDAKTEEKLTIDQAIAKNILDQKAGTYLNTIDNTTMSLADAIDSALLVVEFDQEAQVADPEVVVKTYAIHAVVDQKQKKRVPFSEAIKLDLLNTETGAYKHNVSGEEIYVGDAIKRGFIKATIVHDPNSMDIPTENRMVVDKMDSVKSKLLNPLKALAAFKKASNDGATDSSVTRLPPDGASYDEYDEATHLTYRPYEVTSEDEVFEIEHDSFTALDIIEIDLFGYKYDPVVYTISEQVYTLYTYWAKLHEATGKKAGDYNFTIWDSDDESSKTDDVNNNTINDEAGDGLSIDTFMQQDSDDESSKTDDVNNSNNINDATGDGLSIDTFMLHSTGDPDGAAEEPGSKPKPTSGTPTLESHQSSAKASDSDENAGSVDAPDVRPKTGVRQRSRIPTPIKPSSGSYSEDNGEDDDDIFATMRAHHGAGSKVSQENIVRETTDGSSNTEDTSFWKWWGRARESGDDSWKEHAALDYRYREPKTASTQTELEISDDLTFEYEEFVRFTRMALIAKREGGSLSWENFHRGLTADPAEGELKGEELLGLGGVAGSAEGESATATGGATGSKRGKKKKSKKGSKMAVASDDTDSGMRVAVEESVDDGDEKVILGGWGTAAAGDEGASGGGAMFGSLTESRRTTTLTSQSESGSGYLESSHIAGVVAGGAGGLSIRGEAPMVGLSTRGSEAGPMVDQACQTMVTGSSGMLIYGHGAGAGSAAVVGKSAGRLGALLGWGKGGLWGAAHEGLSVLTEDEEGERGYCCRVCCAALPLQLLMFLLLGMACLLPMSEEEYACVWANVRNSGFMMLRYRDGPPPI